MSEKSLSAVAANAANQTTVQAENTAAISNPNEKTVTLETGIKRGEFLIKTVVLRKPLVGSLRGLSLQDILKWEVNSMSKLLTRISEPTLTESEINSMDIPDFTELNVAVTDFLAPAAAKSQAALMT